MYKTQSDIYETIIQLMCKRLDCASMIQTLKVHFKIPVDDPKREKTIIHRLFKFSSSNVDIKTIWSLLFKISKSIRPTNQTTVENNMNLLSTFRNEIDNIDNELIRVFHKMKKNHCDSNILLNMILHKQVGYRFRLTDECVRLSQQLFEKLSNQAKIFSYD